MVTLVALTSVTVAVATPGSAEPLPGTTATVPVGTNPNAIAISPSGATAYVTNPGDGSANGSVSVIDTTATPPTVSSTLPVQIGPSALAISPNGHELYVVNALSASVSTFDLTTRIADGRPNGGPGSREPTRGVAFSPNGNYAYVANYLGQSLSVIDNTTITPSYLGDVSLGSTSAPTKIAVSPDGSHIYVTNSFGTDNTVSILDASTPSAPTLDPSSVTVGTDPSGIAFAPGIYEHHCVRVQRRVQFGQRARYLHHPTDGHGHSRRGQLAGGDRLQPRWE